MKRAFITSLTRFNKIPPFCLNVSAGDSLNEDTVFLSVVYPPALLGPFIYVVF
jgi:hypothetical protein